MHSVSITTLSGAEKRLRVEDAMYVDGEFVESERTFEVENSATNEVLADVPVATTEQIGSAVDAAERASDEWRELSVWERRRLLTELADLVRAEEDALVDLEVADNGSCVGKLRNDVEIGARYLEYFAGLSHELKGETIPVGPDVLDFTRREPYGAVASIVPFNHPAMFALKKLAPALAAGNGVVVKPSEYTPLSALYLARIVDESASLPDGLVNVVTGPGSVGQRLVGDDGVGLITLIGSVRTGKAVMRTAAENLTPGILELGGKNPVVVFPDADVSRTVQGVLEGMSLAWQGQSCASGSRLLVHEDRYEDVVGGVVEAVEDVAIGDPYDPESEMGTLVSGPHYESVTDYLSLAAEEGEILAGGDTVDAFDTGYFVEPTVVRASPGSRIATEETFGPILTVTTWSEYEDAIETANDVEYGLTASVWTESLETAHHAIDDIEAGYVWVNRHGSIHLGTPFGGFKHSGIGKQGDIRELLGHTRVKNAIVTY